MVYENIILLVHVLLAIGVVAFVLLQRGKGADAGASFGGGGGASQTVFGSSGSGNFLTRTTAILVACFFVTSMALAYVSKQRANALVDINLPAPQVSPVVDDIPGLVPSDSNGLPTE